MKSTDQAPFRQSPPGHPPAGRPQMPLRTTLLRHQTDLGGPEAHFDWLLEPDDGDSDPDRRDVATWRCQRRPDLLEIGESAVLVPIPPHRRWWLGFPIGASRPLTPPLGTATVVSRGQAGLQSTVPMEIQVSWSQSPEVHRLRIEEPTPDRHLVIRLDDHSMRNGTAGPS